MLLWASINRVLYVHHTYKHIVQHTQNNETPVTKISFLSTHFHSAQVHIWCNAVAYIRNSCSFYWTYESLRLRTGNGMERKVREKGCTEKFERNKGWQEKMRLVYVCVWMENWRMRWGTLVWMRVMRVLGGWKKLWDIRDEGWCFIINSSIRFSEWFTQLYLDRWDKRKPLCLACDIPEAKFGHRS